jgi:hypothetical protein
MTVEFWDADQAVTFGPIDADLDGAPSIDRYGVTLEEELHGEPLSVAPAQEEPDFGIEVGGDDVWALVESADDFLVIPFSDPAGRSPEELALHVESP